MLLAARFSEIPPCWMGENLLSRLCPQWLNMPLHSLGPGPQLGSLSQQPPPLQELHGVSTCAVVVCGHCCTNICENEEDAVQCEGVCGMWYHQYCIGVSRSQFQKLDDSDTPFVCQYCSMALQVARITQLEPLVSFVTGEVSCRA